MSSTTEPDALRPLRALTWAVYGLYAASVVVGLTAIAAIVINYVKRPAVEGTLYESHFGWQIRTFWIGLAGMAVAVVTMPIWIGYPIAISVAVWSIFRIVVGALRLSQERPMAEGRFGLPA